MTEQDDELKDLFRQKNLENAFPLDEKNWKKMAFVLRNEQKGKRTLLIYFSLLLLLIGLGGASFFIMQNDNDKSIENLALKSQPTSKNTEIPITDVQQFKTEVVESGSIKQKPKVYKTNRTKKEKLPIKERNAPILKAQQPETVRTKLESTQQDLRTTKDNLAKVEMQETKEKQISYAEKETESSTSIPVTTKQTSSKVTRAEELLQTEEKKEFVLSAITNNEIKMDSNKNNTDYLNKLQTNSIVPDTGFKLNHSRDVSITDDLVKTVDKTTAEKTDSLVTAVVLPKDSILPETLISHRVFLEAGSNYLFGWKTNNKTEANGFNPLIGIQYYHNVSRKISLSMGLNYTIVNNLSSTSHTSTTTRLKFGEENDVTVISALNMHYLHLPLKISYGIDRNNFVSIGYTMAYLLDVQSRVEYYSTRLDHSSTPTVSKSRGYTSGFNPYDGQIALGYRRRLCKELYINGEFFYGLLDVKNNTIYKSDEFERLYGFKLSLSINLWKNDDHE